MYNLIIEAVAVGVITVIFGNITAYIITPLFNIDLLDTYSSWNKIYAIQTTLFLTGFLIHLFCEFSGVNKWYCTNGFACMR